jgi:hypothetical protein
MIWRTRARNVPGDQSDMRQIKVRWGDLGTPTQIGIYRCGAHMVQVTPGDIKLANGDPEKVFTAIHLDFFSEDTPLSSNWCRLARSQLNPRVRCAFVGSLNIAFLGYASPQGVAAVCNATEHSHQCGQALARGQIFLRGRVQSRPEPYAPERHM